MAFRVNRSFGIAPGVRFRLNKRSVGLTFGKGPFHYTVNSRGRRTSSVGIPGTGMYFQESAGGGSQGRSRRTAPGPVPAAAPATPAAPPVIQGSAADAVATSMRTRRPSLFAPRGEKRLHAALLARDPAAVERVASEFPAFALPAQVMLAITAPIDDADETVGLGVRARALYSALAAGDPAADRFLRRYAPGLVIFVPVTEQVNAELPVSHTALALLYVETLQALGRVQEAADYVARLPRDPVTSLSLAELRLHLERWDDIIDLTTGVENTDDTTALLLVYRGIAFREQGFHDAARAALRDALRSKKREPTIRHLALFARAQTYLEQGRRASARKDLETILNEDPDYEGLTEALQALTGATDPPDADRDDLDDAG